MKKIKTGKAAIEKMLVGIDKVADAVTSTMGPKGRNVYIMDEMIPKITNDGVTIANKIVLADQEEDAGAYIIRNVSSQQNEDVGDGTTSVTLLTQTIIHEALKRPENPMVLKESLKLAGDKLLKILAKKSIKIEKDDIKKVALISAENEELAKLITEIIGKLGNDAVINVEDSKTFATDYEIVDGYEAQAGFMSPYFITDKKTGKAVYEDVSVLVVEKKISNLQDIGVIFDQMQKAQISKCVIVCEDIEDSILGLLVFNKMKGVFNSLVIRATAETLRDVAGATGATAISNNTGITFQTVKLEHLGNAKKVVCDAGKTLFIGDGIASKAYAEELESRAENETNMYVQKKIKDRVARLRGGIASLRIGAPTDLEREYLKMKAEDAVKATQAAIAEGVVEGGGMALWRIAQELNPKTPGEEILRKSLTAPLKKIIENSGKEYAEIISQFKEGDGYDAKNDKILKVIEAGIIDPAKVVRCGLENAISSASTVITTTAIITSVLHNRLRTLYAQ